MHGPLWPYIPFGDDLPVGLSALTLKASVYLAALAESVGADPDSMRLDEIAPDWQQLVRDELRSEMLDAVALLCLVRDLDFGKDVFDSLPDQFTLDDLLFEAAVLGLVSLMELHMNGHDQLEDEDGAGLGLGGEEVPGEETELSDSTSG